MIGPEIFNTLQRQARSDAAKASKEGTPKAVPTSAYLLRRLLESFLDRLTRTEHAGKLVPKGGMLPTVYGARRPTMDIDAAASARVVLFGCLRPGLLDPRLHDRGVSSWRSMLAAPPRAVG